MSFKNPIMIISGMGPQASIEIYEMLIKKSVSLYGAKNNEDFPSIVIQSLSVPDFIQSRKRQGIAIKIIKQAMWDAENFDPAAVGMACNTAHLFESKIREGTDLPFVSMIRIVAESVSSQGFRKVELIASPTTVKTKLYKDALASKGIECIVPYKAELIQAEAVIRTVIAGSAGIEQSSKLKIIATELIERGAEAVVLGCTELPLVFPKNKFIYPTFDCLDLLADKLLETYYQE